MTTTQAPQDFLTTLATTHPDKLAVVEDLMMAPFAIGPTLNLKPTPVASRACLWLRVWALKDRVIWCGQNSPWVVALMAAARKLGAVAVPLNYRLTAEEAAYVVDNSDAAVAFIDASSRPLRGLRSEAPNLKTVLVFDAARQGLAVSEAHVDG